MLSDYISNLVCCGFEVQPTSEPTLEFFSKRPFHNLEVGAWIYRYSRVPNNPSCLIETGIRIIPIETIIDKYSLVERMGSIPNPGKTFRRLSYEGYSKDLGPSLLKSESALLENICSNATQYYEDALSHTRNFTLPKEFPFRDPLYQLRRTVALHFMEGTYSDALVDKILKEHPSPPSYIRGFMTYVEWLKSGDA